MKTISITLNGLSPLLMHNPQGMTRTNDSMNRKTIPTPEDEAEKSLYILPDNNLFVPAVAVRNCMLGGAKGYRIGKKSAVAILSGAVLMVDEAFPLYRNGKPISNKDYTIDVRRAVVQRQGITRARARIEIPWQLECAFDLNENLANLDNIETAMNAAGQIVGLLDYRVEKKGWFGRFEVVEIKETK